ncbi:hypothetical protein [Rubrivivax rivuli]|uniref:Uncharacterized protein n=1 Tax=Rubrivivax rivuli TaxID=1862385 RepID=A0A437RIE0_9BURK|nr:hypothetical protein [Rubrivivax rivuli]RVU46521.1 hypothetical protein EOE66_11930 [Rubrivivax rivuli]
MTTSAAPADWFSRLFGFREGPYAAARERLALEGDELVSRVNGARYATGRLEVASLATLRERTPLPPAGSPVRQTLHCVAADARALHAAPENAGALFQVASQFNLLEMVGPDVSPEDGVTRYQHDRTQGPACAMAAGAATVYRNYFAPVPGTPAQQGQTAARQIDTLAPLGAALAAALHRATGREAPPLWTMRNGYALCRPEGLAVLNPWLRSAPEAERDALRAALCIGLHHGVEVTDLPGPARPRVTQAFCSALPVAYGRGPSAAWEPLARLVLEAAYEATLRAALTQQQAGGSGRVLLTRLGGGAFGNDAAWIDDAMARALALTAGTGLQVQLVSYGSVPASMAALAARTDLGL